MNRLAWFQDSYRRNTCSKWKFLSNNGNLSYVWVAGDARIRCICRLLNHSWGLCVTDFTDFSNDPKRAQHCISHENQNIDFGFPETLNEIAQSGADAVPGSD